MLVVMDSCSWFQSQYPLFLLKKLHYWPFSSTYHKEAFNNKESCIALPGTSIRAVTPGFNCRKSLLPGSELRVDVCQASQNTSDNTIPSYEHLVSALGETIIEVGWIHRSAARVQSEHQQYYKPFFCVPLTIAAPTEAYQDGEIDFADCNYGLEKLINLSLRWIIFNNSAFTVSFESGVCNTCY